jgi:hypothetical protein
MRQYRTWRIRGSNDVRYVEVVERSDMAPTGGYRE